MSAIFKREYRAYFSTPLGYVFIAAFLAVINVAFYAYNVSGLTSQLSFCFYIIVIAMHVLTPLLTMRLISEEKKQKTDQLSLTAPVSLGAIVLGKYFAAVAVFLTGLAFTVIWLVIVGMFGTILFAQFIGNLIAVILLVMALIGIGLFISALTENQFVAAVLTLVIFALLYLLDMLSGSISYLWIKNLIGWISMITRFTSISDGLLSLDDIIYYISISGVFLFLTTRVLEKLRWG